ncbi:MAG: hypothetical protein R3E31_16290 [Chloroflexota bacterium]
MSGAYFEAKRSDYERALARLRETHDGTDAFRATCRDLMRLHASTRERLPILDEFYQTVLAHLPPIHSVLDVACGLNVLTWPWLPLSPDTHYYACDIYGDMIAFVSDVMQIAGISGAAEVRDVVSEPPARPVDLVLLLKLLPRAEQVEKTAVSHLLDASLIPATCSSASPLPAWEGAAKAWPPTTKRSSKPGLPDAIGTYRSASPLPLNSPSRCGKPTRPDHSLIVYNGRSQHYSSYTTNGNRLTTGGEKTCTLGDMKFQTS